MNNALITLNHGLSHHDWPMVERAARELRDQNVALASKNDRLWMERNNNLTNIRDLNTELDIARERMARPITLIVAPAIGRWLAGLPMTTADAVQVACDWIDRQMEHVPDQIVVSTRLAVGMAALMVIVCAGMLWGFEAVAGGF